MGKIVSFENISELNAPKTILLDTSFVINLTHQITHFPTAKPQDQEKAAKASVSCKDFLKRLVPYRTRILTCDLVLSEFCHVIYRDILERKFGVEWKTKYEANPAFIRTGHPKIRRAYTYFNVFLDDKMIQVGEEIRRSTFTIMKHLDICPNDAYIVAVALKNSIDGIAHFNSRDFNRISKYYSIDSYAPPELAQY